MSRSENRSTGVCLLGGAAAALLALSCAASAQTLPSDPSPSCTVDATEFKGWFKSGKPTLNGVVNPADSVGFLNVENCEFYQWAKQMFLWITSPFPLTPGVGPNVFESPEFFDVSPPDSLENRTLIPHTPDFIRFLPVRAAQVGPHGLPVIFDKTGRMLEVERPRIVLSGQLRIIDNTGKIELDPENETVG